MTFALDSGEPLVAGGEDSRRVSLVTAVCTAPGCQKLHLRVSGAAIPEGEGLALDWDAETERLDGADERSRAWLASAGGAWLAPWVEQSGKTLRTRFEQLQAQEIDEPADNRPAPPWRPGGRVSHRALFPADFAPSLSFDGKRWLIVDSCCPDPVCFCSEVALELLSPTGESTKVEGALGNPRPTKATTLGKALWTAVHADSSLLELLRGRRRDIRSWGPFVVSAAYEQARLARRPSAGAGEGQTAAEEGATADAVPAALLQRLFDTASRLHAAQISIDALPPGRDRVELRGSVTRDAWLEVDSIPLGIALFDLRDDETPWLTLSLGFRDEAGLDLRRRRCALGLPLIGAMFVPVVERGQPDGTLGPPSAEDLGIAIAVVEALLTVDHRALGGPRVLEHRAELDLGPIDVRLTIGAGEARPAQEPAAATVTAALPVSAVEPGELLPDDEDEDEDENDDDDLEEPSSGALPIASLVEAFTDYALDRALPIEVVTTARLYLDAVVGYAFDQGLAAFEDRTWSEFLTSYAPREVLLEEVEIVRAPAALRAIGEFLGEVGHVDARRFRASVERALPTFQRRARDPRHFSKLKELQAGGVIDLDDPDAVDRFFEYEGLTAPPPVAAARAKSADVAPKREPSPTRWSPGPGEPRPAPSDPCGCGSGKRYKKCCMPR